MINQLRKIHNINYRTNTREKGIPIQSKVFLDKVKYTVINDAIIVSAKDNGVICGDLVQMKKMFLEAIEIIEMYER